MNTVRKLNRSRGFSQFELLDKDNPVELLNFEKQVGQKLPDGFRLFLLEYNGGVFNESVFLDSPDGPVVVATFLPISHTAPESINVSFDYFQENGFPGFIPFGSDPGGNYFLLGFTESNLDNVYYWSHETMHATKIIDSFDDFINVLAPDD
ncbi:MAG: SMI1/KNR4 family protein [Uliginosibacterium sp.]|jgi:hypothetical protein|nr:SMI1/KNR4 family protein [Uliginosibacterium sp.]MBK9616366.1 SMI1/KNR4 family protein [Uliginosibacterium sp.]